MLTNNSDLIHQRMTDEPMSSSQTRITTLYLFNFVYNHYHQRELKNKIIIDYNLFGLRLNVDHN